MKREVSEIINSLMSIAEKRKDNKGNIYFVISGDGDGEVKFSTYDYDIGFQQHTLFEFNNFDEFDDKINRIINE